MSSVNNTTLKKMTYNGQKVKKWYHNGVRVYAAGSTVTYHVDTATTYTEEVDSEATCLAPKTFTPSKSGWTFVGWREDTTASASVLTSKVMGDTPINLYAVFSQNVTVTYYNNSTTASSTSGTRYYNNNNVANPSFKLAQASKSGWSARGWSTGTAGNSSITYKNNTSFTRDSNVTLYGMYEQGITCTFLSNGNQTASGTRYYNSNGQVTNASVTVPSGVGISGWSWRGWSAAGTTTGNAGVTYANGATISGLTAGATYYGLYQQTITVTYYNNSTSPSTTTGTRYYNAAGNYTNPSFTLTQAASSGWSARGWSTTNSGNAGITYNNGATFTRDSNITLYGLYQQTITVTYYNNSGSPSYAYGTRYWAPAGAIDPSFTLTQAAKSGWSARGWSTTNAGNAGVSYNNGAAFTRSSNITLYGMYYQTITLSYNGNGATSGSTAAQTGTVYWAPAGTIGATLKLASNGFTRTNYSFNGWDLGAVGASVTLTTNKTAYATWVGVPYTWVSNYVGSGAPLTITITDAYNDESYVTGDTLSRFSIEPSHDDSEDGVDCNFQTNMVDTRGLKYMHLNDIRIYLPKNDGGTVYQDVCVMSSNNTVLKRWTGGVYSSQTVDVSSASSVYIKGEVGGWGLSAAGYITVPEIKFSN